MNPYCIFCASTNTEFDSCEWQKYMNEDSDELVSLYKCNDCGNITTVRDETWHDEKD